MNKKMNSLIGILEHAKQFMKKLPDRSGKSLPRTKEQAIEL